MSTAKNIASFAAKALLVAAVLMAWVWFARACPVQGAVEGKPGWRLTLLPLPTDFAPGSTQQYFAIATNVGPKATSGPIELKVQLPSGIEAVDAIEVDGDPESPDPICTVSPQTVSCVTSGPLHPSRWLGARIEVAVAPSASGTLQAQATVSGGGSTTQTTSTPTTISSLPSAFGFIGGDSGFGALLTDPDVSAPTQAGSHPDQFTLNFGFPVDDPGGELTSADHVHEVVVDLPPGLLGNPTATPVLCTEAELTGPLDACPRESQVGVVGVLTVTGPPLYRIDPIYNMVPPPGVAAEFGFDADGVGIYVHPSAQVRSDGDYGVRVNVKDLLAFPLNPVLASTASVWGDPSAKSHDQVRTVPCIANGGSCPVDEQQTALLTMPTSCSGPFTVSAEDDSWEQQGVFHRREVQSTDIDGASYGIENCGASLFEPSIEANPTTDLADSPAGLDFTMHQPQNTELEGLSSAALKDAVLRLSPGLVVNPSAASGQGVCDVTQVGLRSAIGTVPAHFSKDPASCPSSSRIGELEATTPLLAQIDPTTHEVLRDSQGNALRRPLEGSVYLAKPFQNPFKSLIALYLVIEDPASGTVAKLAVEVAPDLQTGQLTNTLLQSPQLPIEDVRIKTFTGPRAALRTPSTCGSHESGADLTPWSAPEGLPAHPTDSYEINAAPGGLPCAGLGGIPPHQLGFSAGTLSARAATYSTFVAKISREDGTQPIRGLESTLPKGLLAKLAGVPYCGEAQIARAAARSNPEEGKLEQADLSCPATSEIGSLDVAAGAGPTPLHTGGHIYLAGPYKGAPLSIVIVTPAVAGPFDLGTVVVRAALYVDPERAQGRVVSDPLPTILEGIPLDLRAASVRIDRPQFTLNPTNCEPKAVLANATSLLGQSIALSSPFATVGCNPLAFKPKLSINLKGKTQRAGHPALSGILRLTPGQANVKRMEVALPRSEFLDQAHIGTVCTRVQFAADQCPPKSIYGRATAFTPLLSEPLEGPVYLRSSNHELPDLVIALHGQVDVVLAGRVDSIRGGIRTTFENVPDAPATKVILKMRGGKRGLLINSANLCKLPPAQTRAAVKADGQNGRRYEPNPVLKNSCAKKGGGKPHKGRQ